MPSNAPTAKQSTFRFTLRESLLAMVAAAALLAFAAKSYEKAGPFIPTGVFESLDAGKAQSIVAAIGRQLGLETIPMGSGSGGSTGGDSASREVRLTVRTPSESHAKIVMGLQKQIEEMLTEDECVIVSSGGASENGKENLTQFSFDYEKERTRGHLFVHRVPNSIGTLNLFILLHEFKR